MMLPSISEWSATPGDHPRLKAWFCSGLVLGFLVSSLFSWRWMEAGSGTRVSVLGTGKYLSVLITHNQRRVLIVSGNDGQAFSNALSAALPPIAGSIDILLIDPRSSEDVTERARSHSAKRVMILPDKLNATDLRSVQQSFLIDMGDGVSISIQVLPQRKWTATVESEAGRILISPDAEEGRQSSIHISLDGSFSDSSGAKSAIEISPTARGMAGDRPRAVVGAGDVLTITVDDSGGFRLPPGSAVNA